MANVTTRSQARKQLNQIQIESSSIHECGVFNIIETKYDGNCLFSSIFDFINNNKDQFKKIPPTAESIRKDTVDYILSRNAIGFQQNWDRFWWSIKYNLETHIASVSDYGQNDKKDESIKKQYSEYMKQTITFGTFTELCAAAELYGFQGYIIQQNESNEFIVYEFGFTDNTNANASKPTTFLYFTGEISKGHFRRLEPMIAPNAVQSGKYKAMNENQDSTRIIIKTVPQNVSKNLNALPPPPRRVSCDVCNESFKSAKGLATHRKRHMDEAASQKLNDENTVALQQTWPCYICKQSFGSSRGLATHRNRHVKEANEKTAKELNERLIGSPTTQSKETTKTPSSELALEAECNKWKKALGEFENSETLNEAMFDENVESFQNFVFKANERLPGPQHPSIKFYRLRQQKKKQETNIISAVTFVEPTENGCQSEAETKR